MTAAHLVQLTGLNISRRITTTSARLVPMGGKGTTEAAEMSATIIGVQIHATALTVKSSFTIAANQQEIKINGIDGMADPVTTTHGLMSDSTTSELPAHLPTAEAKTATDMSNAPGSPASNADPQAGVTPASDVTVQVIGQVNAERILTLMVVRFSRAPGRPRRMAPVADRGPPRMGRGIKIPKTTLQPEKPCVTNQS
jgi:hypothetical protein